MSDVVPNICGKELEKDGAAWIAAKCILPMLSLRRRIKDASQERRYDRTYESPKPNVALAWLSVI